MAALQLSIAHGRALSSRGEFGMLSHLRFGSLLAARVGPCSALGAAAVLLGIAGVFAGCQPNAAPHPGGPSAAISGAAGAASAGAVKVKSAPCEDAEGCCESDEKGHVWNEAEQAWLEERCGEGSVCLGGRCASLRLPKGEAAIRREDLLAIAGEGWVNGWGIEGPVKAPAAMAPGGWASGRDFKAACGASGFVPVFERASQKKIAKGPELARLAGYLISGKARHVQLNAGFGGRMRVYLGDKLVLDEARPSSPKPFKDEVAAEIDLGAGVTPITVLLERRDEAASGVFLRFKDPNGRSARDLLFAFPQGGGACGLNDLASVDMARAPIKGGFSVEIKANLMGLSPRGPLEAPLRAELFDEGKLKNGREIATSKVTVSEFPRGGSAAFSVLPEKPGDFELGLAIGAKNTKNEITRRVKLVYRGDLHARIVDLHARAPDLAKAAKREATRDSFLYHVDTLVRALAENHPDKSYLAARTADAEKIAKSLAAGEDPYSTKTGIVHRAYTSELDGRLQPYVAFIPPSYKRDASKSMPLIITFHGLESQPEHALRAVIGEAVNDAIVSGHAARHLPSFPDYGVLLAAPWGYGKAGQRQLGEHDVLRVIREMRESYRVDERRISITGASLGGTVSFVVPLHYPDLFSAAAPLCGYPNLLTWTSVRSTPHTPWEDVLLQKRYIGNYAENGLHLPLHIIHGGRDGPDRSRVIADRYRELGYEHKFDVQDELDHNVWEYGYEDGRMIAWLKSRARPEKPARVRLTTGEYRYSKAHWVRLIAMTDASAIASIDARVAERTGEIKVTTRNVDAFGLDLGGFDLPSGASAVIDKNNPIPLPEGASAKTVFFARASAGGAFERVENEPSRAGKKRPGVSGPLDDILRHPVLIVYGTQDPAQTEANRRVAEHFAAFDHWAYARFPIAADTEATAADLAQKSLILIGGPASNRVTADFIGSLPVRFEANALTVRGKRYEGRDLGVSLIHPHPKNEAEYIVLHAGVGDRGTLASRHLPQLVPDYLVYDARITIQRGELLLDKRAVLDGGFFDQSWR
jgi:enterochelin esterase-like enzyme